MLRLWLTPRWLLVTAGALVLAVACWMLGTWQWGRYEGKQVRAEAIATHYDATPVALETVFAEALTPEQQWTRVTFPATFQQDNDLMVRNRSIEKVSGFEVLTPATTPVGTLLLDRGWVQSEYEAEETPPVDAPPSGEVTVTGWLRTSEPNLGRDLPAPQLASINIDEARTLVPDLSPALLYVVVDTTEPAAVAGSAPLTALPRPTQDLGPHQAYAIQWWITVPGGLVFVWFLLRREVQNSPEYEAKVRTPKPKKVRIWDEEDY